MDYISYSQLRMYLRCGYQYYLRYVKDIKLPPDGGLTRGSACHNAILKSRSGKDGLLSAKIKGESWCLDQTIDAFNDSIESLKTDTEWNNEKLSYETARNTGQDAVKGYHKFAQSVEPEAVEVEGEAKLDGVLYKGYIDIITPAYNADLKFRSRKMDLSVNELLQMGIYNMFSPKPFSMIHSVIMRKKGVEVIPLNILAEELPVDRLKAYTEMFMKAKDNEIYLPCNPDDWGCSPDWCGYTRICPYYSGKKGSE